MSNINLVCAICKSDKPKTTRGLLNHIRTHNITSKEYYDRFYKSDEDGICKSCGSGTRYHGFAYSVYCSDSCYLKTEDHKNKVRNRFNGDDREEKLKLLAIRRGTVDTNPEKAKLTNEKKAASLGLTLYEYQSMLTKASAAKVTPEEKRRQVLLAMETKARNRNYGFCKNGSYKDYYLGESLYRVQGYEPDVLDAIRNLVDDSDIFLPTKSFYINYNDYDGKQRMYFPDAILYDDIVVEVKSTYTYKHTLRNTEAKLLSCRKQGYKTLLVVINVKQFRNEKLERFEKLLDLAISSQATKVNEFRYVEGSTTSQYDVGSSDPKCQES